MSQTTELLLKIRQQGGEQLTKLQSSLKGLGQQSTATNVNFKQLAAELKDVQQTSVNSINNLKGYASAWREIANSVKIGSAEFKQATAEAAKLDAQLRKARPSGGRLAAGAQIAGTVAGAGVFGGVEGALGAGIGAVVGMGVPGAVVGGAIGAQIGGVRQALGGTATYAAEITRQRQALQLVTKNAGEYQRALEFIDKTSRELAIPQEIITRQFTQLTASVKGAGGNVRDAEKAFVGIASGIRGTGGSLEQLDSALTATSQVFSKGKVSAEELRQQIGERLPGAFSLFAKSIGMTPQELDKALEKGQVSLLDFQKFAEELFKEYGENAKIIADGPDAAGDRLRASLSRLSESVGTLLKPIGAAFQNEFAKIILVIDNAIKKLNEFFGLGKGRQGEINRLQKVLDATDASLKRYEQLFAQRGGKMGLEESAYRTLQQRKASTFSQLSALLAAQTAAPSGGPEPPSKLPGIVPDEGKSDAEKLQRLAQQEFNKTLQQLGVDLAASEKKFLAQELIALEKQRQEAVRRGDEIEQERLNLAERQLRIDVTENALLTEREKLEALLNEGKAKGLDVTRIGQKLSAVNVAFAENELQYQKLVTEEYKFQNKLIDKQIKDFYKRAGLKPLQDIRGGAGEFALDMDLGKQLGIGASGMQLEIKKLEQQLKDLLNPVNTIINAATSIGDAFSQSFSDIITGTKSAQQAIADFFGAVGKALIDYAAQALATYIALGIARAFAGLSGGGGLDGSAYGASAFGSGSSTFTSKGFASAVKLVPFAEGGYVTGPTAAMIGEAGQSEYVIPASKMQTAMSRYSRGARGQAVVSGNGTNTESAGGTAVATAPIDVRYSVERINQVDYVTADQFQAGMRQAAAQGAKQGEQRALSTLRQNTNVRRSVGI
jgi:tape measure domain-containing protein